MEVIKRGDWQPPTFSAEIECYNCHSVLKINADDVLGVYDDWDDSYEVKCPVCGHRVEVTGEDKKNYLNYLKTRKLN